jgi:hypothetical protein
LGYESFFKKHPDVTVTQEFAHGRANPHTKGHNMKLLYTLLIGLALLATVGSTINEADGVANIAENAIAHRHSGSVGAPADASIGVSVSIEFDFFYDRLSPHGEWVEVGDHGWCWSPYEMEADWHPYSDGHWIYADDCGWYWHSDYEWSWAGHHYGRWVRVESNWRWVPGYEWSGAWVAWRHGGGYVGWAPLSPQAHWEIGVGIRTTSYSHERDIAVTSWGFVAEASFTSTTVHTAMVKRSSNHEMIGKTKVQGSVSISGGIIVNTAITHESAASFTGKKVSRHKLHDSETLGASAAGNDKDEIRVFRPKVSKGNAKPHREDDKAHKAESARKTLNEKHDAEEKELPARQKKSGKDEKARESELEDMKKRHKKEEQESDERHGKSGKDSDRKPDREPDNESGKKPDNDDEKESGKKPEKEDDKGSGKKPEKEDDKGSGKKPEKDPGKKGGKKE